MLHGQPTWGYIYRRFIAPIAATHRVIVPDHMGFGKSESAAGPRIHLVHPCRESDRVDRIARPTRHHVRDAGLGRPDRHWLCGAPPGACAQSGADEYGVRLWHRGPSRSAQSDGVIVVPVDFGGDADGPDRGGAVPPWFNHLVGDADCRAGAAGPRRSDLHSCLCRAVRHAGRLQGSDRVSARSRFGPHPRLRARGRRPACRL